MNLNFVWDKKKNQLNTKKHRVSFGEAETIFLSRTLEIFYDPDHSEEEDRYIAVGLSHKGRTLLVVHCENEPGTEIRIISARKATPKEAKNFFGGKTR